MLIGDRLTFGKCELRQRFGYCRGDDGAENFWIGAAPWMAITVSIGHRREKLLCAALPCAGTVQALCRRLRFSAIPVADDFAMNSVA